MCTHNHMNQIYKNISYIGVTFQGPKQLFIAYKTTASWSLFLNSPTAAVVKTAAFLFSSVPLLVVLFYFLHKDFIEA